MNNKLYVSNLSFSVDNDALRAQFTAYGTVTSAQVILERDTGRSRGFGFVEMGSESEAQAAIEGLHGQPMGGRALSVAVARARS